HIAVTSPVPSEAGREPAAPSRRWPTLAAVIGAGAILLIVAVFTFRPDVQGAASVSAPASLIVRPFATLSDTALGIGLANAITTRLGGQQILAVRSAPAAGEDARWPPGVTHALDGDIAIRGTDVSVFARLRDVSGQTVWSDRFQLRTDELFSVEDVIAERVVGSLSLRLAAAE